MKALTAECRAFLLSGTRTGKLATVRPDGQAHIAPIWFILDGDTLVFTTWHATVKAANMRRDARACLCVDDEQPPFAYVQIEGTVEMSNDMPALKYWATKIGGRYMGEERAEEFGNRNAVAGELLVRLMPTKVIFKQNIAGYE